MEINYVDGVQARQTTLGVTGTSEATADLVISETDPYDYFTVVIGSVAEREFTVTNNGEVTATGVTGSGLAATDFRFKGGGAFPGTGGTCNTGVVLGLSLIHI